MRRTNIRSKIFPLFVYAGIFSVPVFLLRAAWRNADHPPPSPKESLSQGRSAEGGDESGGEEERDVVDQASWESFPASDPPAW